MFEPELTGGRLPRWVRVVLLACATVFTIGLGLFTYQYMTHPHTLTVATGSLAGEGAVIMSTIANRLASTNAPVRLKVIDTGNPIEVAKTFAAGKADLAIARADLADLAKARAVVLVANLTVLLVVPPGVAVEDMDDLKGKTVGVVGGEVNHHLAEVLSKEYDLTGANVQFRDLTAAEARQAVQAKQVSALLVAIPLTEKYLSLVRDMLPAKGKSQPKLLAIESAGAIANVTKAYESYDLPKGTLRGSPAIPDDDLTTLRIPIYLIAHRDLASDDVMELTKAVMDARRELLGAHPVLAQIASPSTESDAFIPIHAGAKAYFDGDHKTFFDKYGDALFYGPMALGALTSLFAAAWKFMGIGTDASNSSLLASLGALANRIREAGSPADLAAVEDEIDGILMSELAKYTNGNVPATDAAVLSMAAHRLELLMSRRRSTLGSPVAPGAT
jgi:TRAP transporter TAXI family solute receptor